MTDQGIPFLPSVAEAKVGDGVSVVMWSDRRAATVIHKTAARITIQWDRSVVVKGSTQDGSAQYDYLPNPDGIVETYSLRKNGRWVRTGDSSTGCYLVTGRCEYHDPHF